ncbi:ALDOSE-1-EPIMERASE [Salix purpurea]|uniref:ALDOSE-1-EPIMERASE n=1 Tax=Salix purpurea TaxID=77065 RepID=A0A9Q0W8R5_SALPP|nr:ALDOSE-1-EPIMERASE [Salix purpurea]
MWAKPLNKPAPVSLALHAYWNLGGHNSGDIFSQTIQLFGSEVTPRAGRKMEPWTHQPGPGGFVYAKHAGVCLKTPGFPDAVNHLNFPPQIVTPGGIYQNIMIYWSTAH